MTTHTLPPLKPAAPKPSALRVLKGTRILSLALNVPGPVALLRARQMGAQCVKLEPPAHPGAPAGSSGDPLGLYNRKAYLHLHEGVRVVTADLKTDKGQAKLHQELARADVLLTSFRPSALKKLGLQWKTLHAQYPSLSMVCIFGGTGDAAEAPGHDLTYLAENDLVVGLDLPPTLFADMGGALMTSEAVLQARLHQLQRGKGVRLEVALSQAAQFLAMPRGWGLTKAGSAVGGGHAGYKVYPCQDGRVALAALEPHFAMALAQAVGLPAASPMATSMAMFAPETHTAVAAFALAHTRRALDELAAAKDIPLFTLPNAEQHPNG